MLHIQLLFAILKDNKEGLIMGRQIETKENEVKKGKKKKNYILEEWFF